jgi:hypothetical protein
MEKLLQVCVSHLEEKLPTSNSNSYIPIPTAVLYQKNQIANHKMDAQHHYVSLS